MRGSLSALLALVAACACGCDATGGEQGGQALAPDPCDATKGGHTWSDLYTCYFGPTGKANCSAQAGCHVNANSSAASLSAFVCGATKEDCWYGMTHPIYILQGPTVSGPPIPCDAGSAGVDGSCPMPPADAGPDAAPICSCFPSAASPDPPIVPTGGTADPTTTYLLEGLHGPSPMCPESRVFCDNMPCGNLGQNCPKHSGAYTFSADDLARISAWIKEGAQDN
jgi:hypothetical protein